MASVYYWTAALANLAVISFLVVRGVLLVRRGEVERHRRSMRLAAFLVLGFLGSYVLKLMVLGRENLAVWSAFDLNVLRFHELCVSVMLLAGGGALFFGGRLRATRLFTRDPSDPEHAPGDRKVHRIAGIAAILGAIAGFLSAGMVLAGMYARASA